ncbi:cupin [Candidatus Shapirobacteria bacterium]|nr:MAG: cupin [Candidatus Shapirobacteria bacterium]
MKTISIEIDKPWGGEIILTSPNSPYTAKILHIKAGHRFSLQYHDQKVETLTLVDGQAEITLGPNPQQLTVSPMQKNQGYTITTGTIHRIKAITDATVLETSTGEKGNTIRLEDDYHRSDESETDRQLARHSS